MEPDCRLFDRLARLHQLLRHAPRRPAPRRHTRGTWLAQAGVPAGEAAASLGLTAEEYERTYLHNDPAFQQRAADAY